MTMSIAESIASIRAQFEKVPVGASGKRNGNALNAVLERVRGELERMGMTHYEACDIAEPMCKEYRWQKPAWNVHVDGKYIGPINETDADLAVATARIKFDIEGASDVSVARRQGVEWGHVGGASGATNE